MAQIAYTMGYFLSWLYVCVFMIVFIPLFSVSMSQNAACQRVN